MNRKQGAKICCCCSCCTFFIVLLWVAIRVATASCAIESFDYSDILPAAGTYEPFDRGTSENMFLDPSLGIDLAGTWWMDGNPLTAEQLVSYAGASNDPDEFPLIMTAPSNKQRRWTWSDTLTGRGIIAYYMLTTTPETTHLYEFTDSSYANIVPVAGVFGDGVFGFRKTNDSNEWDRVDTYKLHRIVSANGTATELWPKFEKWYLENFPDGRMIVVSSDNNCLRRCQYFLLCFMCDWFC